MPESVSGFIGVLLSGTFGEGPAEASFTPSAMLGTGFIADPASCIALTNMHVLESRTANEPVVFALLDRPGSLRLTLVDLNSIQQWDHNDLAAFTFTVDGSTNASQLRSAPFHGREALMLGEKVLTIGVPFRDVFDRQERPFRPIVRAITGFIVTSYEHETEIDSPVISGMSGSPVIHGCGAVLGVVYDNRHIGSELRRTETEELSDDSSVTLREVYEYRETVRLGVFYHASSFLPWLRNEVGASVELFSHHPDAQH